MMKPKLFLALCAVLASVAVIAQYQPNDVVRSVDFPTVHVTFDNLAAGAGTQAETMTNAGSSRFYRRLRFEALNPTDNTQMPNPWIEFVGHFDSNASVGTITNSTYTIGGFTATWNADNTLTLWLGGTGGGSSSQFGIEGNNLWPVFQGLSACGTVSRTGRAQLCYDTTLNALRLSTNGGAWASLFAGTPGTVTSVGLALPSIFTVTGSPVTTTGTLTGTLASQSPNLFFASPNGATGTPTFRAWLPADAGSQTANTVLAAPNGSAGAPTFRAHVAGDFPTGVINSAAILDGTVVFADWSLNSCLAGQVPTINAGATAWICSTPAGTGTVTSVALAAPAEFTVSGSPVTSSGTITLAKATQAANLIYAGPTTGAAAAPTFRALVAADLPSTGSTTWCVPQITEAQFPTTAYAYYDTVADHTVLDFVNGSATSAYFLCTLPSNYDATSLVVVVDWASSATTGNVVWGANIENQKSGGWLQTNTFGGVAGNGSTQTTTTTAANTTTNGQNRTNITYTNGNAGSPGAHDLVRLRLQRVGNNAADTMAAIANLHSVFIRK